jgi:hypothetical protein
VVKTINDKYLVFVLRVRRSWRLNPFCGLKTGKLLYVYVKFKIGTRRGQGLVFWFDEGFDVCRKLDFRISGGVGQQPQDCFLISCVCCFVQSLRCFLGSEFRGFADYYHGVLECCL